MAQVAIQRTIRADPERVYRAWLDPDVMVRWFAPEAFRASRAEVDERVGGQLRVWHSDDEKEVGGGVGEIVELVPNERIVLRWWFGDPDEPVDPVLESRLTLTFEPAGDATLLTLTHDRLDGLAGANPEIADNVEGGWTEALESLRAELEK